MRTVEKDCFTIYQLKSEKEQFPRKFPPFDLQIDSITKEDYDKVYTDVLGDMTLEDIFERFNINIPEDFTGHSLSVSDVIVLHQNGQKTVHYVDNIGFKQLDNCKWENPKQVERKLSIERCLTISTCHISEETARKIEQRDSFSDSLITIFDKGEYGWWIWIPKNIYEFFGNEKNKIPKDLWICMILAWANKCDWLCLDCDGYKIEGMTSYDW